MINKAVEESHNSNTIQNVLKLCNLHHLIKFYYIYFPVYTLVFPMAP